MRKMLAAFCVISAVQSVSSVMAEEKATERPALFKKIQLSDQFYSEGANFGDFNHDGKQDVVAGPFWYEGPDFQKKHQYMDDADAKTSDPHHYSNNFFAFSHDFRGDGWSDILILGFPGKESFWYENPRGKADKEGPWKKHIIFKTTDNESPTFGDLLGTGKPVLICTTGGRMGYAQPDWSDPTKEWVFHPTSPKLAWQKFTHGLGYGDINGDGKLDLLDKDGWYEQPKDLTGDPNWVKHPYEFAKAGGAQMLVCDVNGDGLPDVITSLEAHGYGLAWFEQKRDEKGGITFVKHLIMGSKPEENAYGLHFSQLHAQALADIDGDGVLDLIAGKRFWAHGPDGDKDPSAPAVLYFFRIVRKADKTVDFMPYLIDDNSGVGTQVVASSVGAGSDRPNIVVGNKKGTFVFINQLNALPKDTLELVKPKEVK